MQKNVCTLYLIESTFSAISYQFFFPDPTWVLLIMIGNFMGTKIINLPEVQPVDTLEDDDVPLECDVALLDETVRRGEEAEAVQVAAARPPHSPHELPHGTVKEKKG